jgi:chemotaxis protein MotB
MMGLTNRRMWASVVGVMVAVIGGGLGGCANQAEYDGLRDTNRAQAETIERLQRELRERELELANLQRTGMSGDTALQAAMQARNDAEARLAAAQQALANLEGRLNSTSVLALDSETDTALANLASRYPSLVEYDSARGMLRFNSDLTFASGQAVVNDSAKQSLAALADILNSGSATAYEVQIVGHTDSQKISDATAKRGHPTNMHLSCHRAIAVRDSLKGLGVTPGKMYAAGWGEERPRVPNSGNGNTPANRRVEIYLQRSTASFAAASPSTDAQPAVVPVDRQAAPVRQPDMTK